LQHLPEQADTSAAVTTPPPSSIPGAANSLGAAEPALLRQTIDEQTSHLDQLAVTVDELLTRQQELRRLLHDAHTQLVERDDELARLRAHQRELDAQLAIERKRLRTLQASRWWRFRQTIVRVVGR
jgi:hypothetical protein